MPKNGLTLIELMAALAVSGLLVTAALTAATTMGRVDAAERGRIADDPPSSLRDVLATDVGHAREYRVADTGFSIRTWATLDVGTMELQHRPTTVTYYIVELAGRRWLLRRQQADDHVDPRVDLAAPDVVSIHLSVEDEAAANVDSPWRPMQTVATVTVTFGPDRPEAVYVIRNR